MVRHGACGSCAATVAAARMTVMKAAILMIMFATTALAQTKPMLVMHGGAGTITRAGMTPELEKQYREKLEEALRAGHAILMKGGAGLDAVEASIRILEDSPL